jgi:YfiH family protein
VPVVHGLPGGAHAVFSSRRQGNMSSVGGEGSEGGLAARNRLRDMLGVSGMVRGYQVHGTMVGRVREGFTPPEDGESQPAFEADGHAVAVEGVGAMVLTADCIPVVLGAEGAVAALHAGWRGLAAGVLDEGVVALRDVGGRGEIVAIVGPCAGACCYEVGEEVHAAFRARDWISGGIEAAVPRRSAGRSEISPISDRSAMLDVPPARLRTACDASHPRPDPLNPPSIQPRALGGSHRHGAHIDLRAIAHERLLAAGVAEVRDVEGCTICDERYFSYRREGARAGRQAAVAWISER